MLKRLWICDRNRKTAVADDDKLPAGWEQSKSYTICDDCVKSLAEWFAAGKPVETTVSVTLDAVSVKEGA